MVEERSHADALADELRGEVLRGRYRPGDRLPSERELAARFAVNRLSAREALQQLERLGLIEIRKGGARVAALQDASPDVIAHLFEVGGAPDPALVEQWLDVSEILFTGAVRLALERASDAEIARARELLRGLLRAGTGGEDARYFAALDELGDLIFAGARNLVLRLIRNGLRANVLPRLQGKRARLRPVRAELAELVRAIDDAVAARDPERGQEAVRLLWRANRERILKSLRKERP
ncbi:MAG TPA: GntR family transcriptional regulator [Myxococcota bacterium]|nr:GntR family transcriptional regulator [Myxococcota bacterium]